MIKKFNAIIFLGTSKIQVPSILSAKKNGYKIIGIDKNKNATGKKFCDYFFNFSANDTIKIIKNISKLTNINIISIWANNDIFILSKIKLESKLNIKNSISLVNAKKLLNKSSFNKYLYNSKLSIKKIKKNDFPLIVKPKYGSGSKGIKLVYSKNELLKINKKNFHLEKYLKSGTEYGLNFFVTEKKIYKLPSVVRYFDHSITFAPLGTMTISNSELKFKIFTKIINRLQKKLKIFGQLKLDILISKLENKIFEISPRFHGEIDTSYLFEFEGCSLADFYFSYIRGKKVKLSKKKNKYKIGYFCIFNNLISSNNLKKYFKSNNLEFIKLIKRDNYKFIKNQSPKSTNDIYAYAFFKSKNNLQKEKFISLSRHINRV